MFMFFFFLTAVVTSTCTKIIWPAKSNRLVSRCSSSSCRCFISGTIKTKERAEWISAHRDELCGVLGCWRSTPEVRGRWSAEINRKIKYIYTKYPPLRMCSVDFITSSLFDLDIYCLNAHYFSSLTQSQRVSKAGIHWLGIITVSTTFCDFWFW